MILKKILIIKGGTQYGVLRDFADALKEGFEEHQITVDVFDASLGLTHRDNTLLSNNHYDLVFSFNGMLLGCQESIIKNKNTLFWSFLVDHPYYHHYRLLSKCNNHIVSCVDKNHVDYIKNYYPNIEHSYYMPHGGDSPINDSVVFQDKQYQVCIIGTYNDFNHYDDTINQLPEPDKSIIITILNEIKNGSTATIEQLYERELKTRGLVVTHNMFADLLCFISFIDSYIRAFNRTKILDKLTDAGITVDVFGNGWENYKCKNPNYLNLHGSIPYQDAIRVMQNSKIILNPLPLFRNGSHERVFTSMLCNSVCVSEENTYLSEQFVHGEDIIFFNMTNLDSLVTDINSILSDYTLANKIISNGYSKAKEHHLWKHRSTEIIKIANSILSNKELNTQFININSSADYDFNSFINYIHSFSNKLLVKKLTASYNYYESENANYKNLVRNFQINQGLWDEKDIDGNVFFKNEIRELKNNIQHYINLYNSLSDEVSKETLLGLLNYKLSYNCNLLKNIISNEIIFKNQPVIDPYWENGKDNTLLSLQPVLRQNKPKLKINLNGAREYLWLLPELVIQANSSYKLYLRYYGDGLTPDKVILFCE